VSDLLQRDPWKRPLQARTVSLTLNSVLEDLRAWYSPYAFLR
jgi:hypothetical protein